MRKLRLEEGGWGSKGRCRRVVRIRSAVARARLDGAWSPVQKGWWVVTGDLRRQLTRREVWDAFATVVDNPLLDPDGRWVPWRRVALATLACALLLDRDSGQTGVPIALVETWLKIDGDAARLLLDGLPGVWVDDDGVCGFVPPGPVTATTARSVPVLMRCAQIVNRNASYVAPVVADALLCALMSTPKVLTPTRVIEIRLSERWVRWQLPHDARAVLARVGVGYGMQLTEWHPLARIEERLKG